MDPLRSAALEARRLEHHVVTSGHLLLALLRAEPNSAQDALRAVGYDAEEAEMRMRAVSADKPAGGHLTFAPVMHVLRGRAEAFAAAFGSANIMPEHILLAMMWDDRPTVGRRDGKDVRPEILAFLKSSGVPVPALPPLAAIPEWTQRVALANPADWKKVCEHLRAIGAQHWGTNPLDPGPDSVSTFVACADIDLLAEIEHVLGPGKARVLPLRS